MEKLAVIDRDGTLIKDPYGYFPYKIPDWRNKIEFYEGVIEGLELLINNDVYLAVLTNQAGVARGLIEEEDVKAVNEFIRRIIFTQTGIVVPFFYCIEVPSEYAQKYEIKRPELLRDSKRRKPNIGMIREAAEHYGLTNYTVYSIGDKATDILTGLNAGGIGILVKTGEFEKYLNEIESLRRTNPNKVFIAQDFYEACELIVKNKNF